MTLDSFDPSYRDGTPPWEVGTPQPAVVALAKSGHFSGWILDVACGTGENSLHLASLGHTVIGVDGSPTALERAREKARGRRLAAEFEIADAFDLAALGRRFDTVLDCAFLHIPGNTADARRAYTAQLAAVLEPGGWAHLLEISEQDTEHPSRTRAEILDSFDDQWANAKVQESTYLVTTGEVPAWLISLQRQ